MNKKNIDNTIPIYRLTSKKKIIEYYDKWVIKNKYNALCNVYRRISIFSLKTFLVFEKFIAIVFSLNKSYCLDSFNLNMDSPVKFEKCKLPSHREGDWMNNSRSSNFEF